MGKILICNIKEIPPGHKYKTKVDGNEILIINDNGNFYAVDDMCTHAGASLADGKLEDGNITCDWHGAKFNYKNGELKKFSSKIDNLRSYRISLEAEDIFIEL
ncbi:MAG: non-heme iron oxygenase ferredoxin subunit [Nitrosopumilaceae archaeon]|nr:non-heme iron oxygenase ferredoxin subunit [Nitrosopumilaceae archaeon]